MSEPNTGTAPAPQTPPPQTPAPAPQQPKPGDKPAEPEKLSLTADELNARIDAALKAEQDKRAKADAKAKEEAERKAAEEQGKFKELADKAQQRADALAAENRKLTTAAALRDHLAEKHPEYTAAAKYILPLIPADAEGDALAKAVADAAAQFVKDNPRQPKAAAGAPAAQPRTPVPGGTTPAATPTNGSGRRNLSPIARGF